MEPCFLDLVEDPSEISSLLSPFFAWNTVNQLLYLHEDEIVAVALLEEVRRL